MSKPKQVKITDHQYEMLRQAVCHLEFLNEDYTTKDGDGSEMYTQILKGLNRILIRWEES